MPTRMLIKPCEFAMDLQGELARWRDDQGQRRRSALKPLVPAQKIACNCQPVSDGLARPGLGRNEEIPIDSLFRKHGKLNRGRPIVAALGQSSGERRTCGRE